jgi:parallel beta-helix repeat protein
MASNTKYTRAKANTLITLALVILSPMLMAPGCGQVVVVHRGETIQDAVDRANPGDTILVLPGLYTGTAGDESVVDVQTSNLTIWGLPHAVIDATGFEYGIMVGQDAPIGPDGCPPITVTNFRMKGLTIQNADETGVRLVGVDGFELNYGRYIDNHEYGPFPVCSRNGEIRGNFASGSNDAAIYVGNDQNVDVIDNFVTDSVAGIEIENTFMSVVRGNVLTGNTGGILTFVLANLPQPFTDTVLIEDNHVFDNNRANTGAGAVAGVPVGTGILIIGADNVTVRHNEITGNDSFGIASIGNFFSFLDPRIEPFVDDLVVVDNTIVGNGHNPDPLRTFTPGADIIFLPDVFDPMTGMLLLTDPDPSDNCFEGNTFDVDFPPGVVGLFPCP